MTKVIPRVVRLGYGRRRQPHKLNGETLESSRANQRAFAKSYSIVEIFCEKKQLRLIAMSTKSLLDIS